MESEKVSGEQSKGLVVHSECRRKLTDPGPPLAWDRMAVGPIEHFMSKEGVPATYGPIRLYSVYN